MVALRLGLSGGVWLGLVWFGLKAAQTHRVVGKGAHAGVELLLGLGAVGGLLQGLELSVLVGDALGGAGDDLADERVVLGVLLEQALGGFEPRGLLLLVGALSWGVSGGRGRDWREAEIEGLNSQEEVTDGVHGGANLLFVLLLELLCVGLALLNLLVCVLELAQAAELGVDKNLAL